MSLFLPCLAQLLVLTSGNLSFQASEIISAQRMAKHLLLRLNETESAPQMDKAQGQEIKPLSCWWVQPHAPITGSNPASPDSSACSPLSLRHSDKRDGSSFHISRVSCIHLFPVTMWQMHQVAAAEASGRWQGEPPLLSAHRAGPRPLFNSKHLWTKTSARSSSWVSVHRGNNLKDKLSHHKWIVPPGIVIYGSPSRKDAEKEGKPPKDPVFIFDAL